MADVKIQDLLATTTVADNDLFIVEDNADTKKITWSKLKTAIIGAFYQTGSFSSSISSTAGTITTASLTTGTYTKVGRKVTIYFEIVITINGTGGGAVRIDSLPFQPTEPGFGAGRNTTNGDMLQVEILNAPGGRVDIRAYNNSYPGADGRTLRGSVTYFATN